MDLYIPVSYIREAICDAYKYFAQVPKPMRYIWVKSYVTTAQQKVCIMLRMYSFHWGMYMYHDIEFSINNH